MLIPKAPKPIRDKKHLKGIRELPCVCCAAPGCDPHHLLIKELRGMALRPGDDWCVPLCRQHHDELHALGSRKEADFFFGYGWEYDHLKDVAQALYALKDDHYQQERLILAELGFNDGSV